MERVDVPLDQPGYAFSKAVLLRFPDHEFLHASGMLAARDALDFAGSRYEQLHMQTHSILMQAAALLRDWCFALQDVYRVRVYVVGRDADTMQAIHEARHEVFQGIPLPASTLVAVAGLAVAQAIVEIDFEAVRASRPSQN